MADNTDERRKYPRLNAPLYFRPARRRLPRRQVIDVGIGGIRVYSDEALSIGARFEIELFMPDQTSLTCLTEVMWVRSIEGGLQFLDVPPEALEQLRSLLSAGA